MDIFNETLMQTRCDGCGRYWLGKFYGEAFCNNCLEREAEALAVQEDEALSRSENHHLAH